MLIYSANPAVTAPSDHHFAALRFFFTSIGICAIDVAIQLTTGVDNVYYNYPPITDGIVTVAAASVRRNRPLYCHYLILWLKREAVL